MAEYDKGMGIMSTSVMIEIALATLERRNQRRKSFAVSAAATRKGGEHVRYSVYEKRNEMNSICSSAPLRFPSFGRLPLGYPDISL